MDTTKTKSPTIDFSYLDGMLRLSKGNPRFVTEHVQRFMVNCPRDLREIMRFKQDHDREALKRKTHKFISSCSVVGAMRMINVSYRISTKAKTEDEAQLREWLDELNAEFTAVSESLNEYLAKISATV